MYNNTKYLFIALSLFSASCLAGDIVDDTLQAIQLNRPEIVQQGLQRGLDVNFSDAEGNTLLMLAARQGHLDIVAMLINNGAKVLPSNRFGDTALLQATFGGYEAVVDILLARGGKLTANSNGWTPLHYAAFIGNLRLTQRFIDFGSQVDPRNNNDLTPLMAAARNGHLDVVKYLLIKGADQSLVDGNAKSARDFASSRGNSAIVEVLDKAKSKSKQ